METGTVLITGGAGYIGSHVVKHLASRHYALVVYDNLQTGHRESLKNVPLVRGDLSDADTLRKAFQSYSVQSVMHFAGDCLVGESVSNPLKYFNNNVRNSLQLLEIMCELDIRMIIFSSSAAVYGEPDAIPISEDHPCAPTNPYGETKWIFERTLQAFHARKKVDFISLRYFNAAGADPEGDLGEDHSPETHLIPLILKAALEGESIPIFGQDYETPDGTCIRDYIHVSDLAQAHILALEHLLRGGESGIFNLGNGNGYSVKEVIESAQEVTGKRIRSVAAPRRPGDPARLVACSDRMEKKLGWHPAYSNLRTIIETAWNWHRRHPTGYKQA